jgi:glycerate 2-kinase
VRADRDSSTVMAMDRTKRRKAAVDIFRAGVDSVMPERLMRQVVALEGNALRINGQVYSLRDDQKVYVFGSGKAAEGMAKGLLGILGERIAGGVIVTGQATGLDLLPLTVVEGSHPVPDEHSIRGAELLIKGLAGLRQDDFFIYLLSGGSSALIEKPLAGVSLADMRETTKVLLESGEPIGQINTVRKHLSMVKGGRLGRFTVSSGAVLVISDVIGDDLSVIGSGPLYFDRTTFQECAAVLDRHGLRDRMPPSVRTVIAAGVRGQIPDTPKQEHEAIRHYLIGTNRTALEAARRKARELGLDAHVLTSFLAGEAREAARVLAAIARNIIWAGEPFQPPCCLLCGGETTVTVRGGGAGGRNQELVLAALAELRNDEAVLVLSGGTDGIDGNSTAAGACGDSRMLAEAARLGLSVDGFLADNDSNGFFRRVGGLLETGPTGTNVMDLTLFIIDKEGT